MTRLTPELAAQIRALSGAGMSDAEIGRRLGMSRWAASRLRRAMGLPRVYTTKPDTVRRVREAVAAGEKRAAVAAELGLSDSYVTQLVNRRRRANG